jgi:hypothetical protein
MGIGKLLAIVMLLAGLGSAGAVLRHSNYPTTTMQCGNCSSSVACDSSMQCASAVGDAGACGGESCCSAGSEPVGCESEKPTCGVCAAASEHETCTADSTPAIGNQPGSAGEEAVATKDEL